MISSKTVVRMYQEALENTPKWRFIKRANLRSLIKLWSEKL